MQLFLHGHSSLSSSLDVITEVIIGRAQLIERGGWQTWKSWPIKLSNDLREAWGLYRGVFSHTLTLADRRSTLKDIKGTALG